MVTVKEALEYHSLGRKGKIEVIATKPCKTQRDLALAYTPGVAEPCRMIEKNLDDAYLYTAKGNLVAVISNGTAVLGLGDIGALAGKPVMEGKGVLFKRFADIDVFDIELNTHDPDEFIRCVQLMEPTFGGINLEDIKAPECFYIEQKLIETMNIPVFHDDQHGTAIISGAALLNALEIQKKDIDKVKIVFSGAGAAAIACAKIYLALGAKKENIIFVDTTGVVYKGREKNMNPYKEEFAVDTKCRTLGDAMKGADVFVGLSVKGLVSKEMVKSMNDKPIIFAMANPDPEITYEDALDARRDIIMATGRSDYPNQVNNVLGFPFIFRGALDVHSRAINLQMKLAAVHALAGLAKEDVPDSVAKAYGVDYFKFGPEYIIPKPFDYRVLIWEASAVAKAAIETGVARIKIDIEEYKEKLESRLGKSREVMRIMLNKAKMNPKKVVYPEGEHEKILRASHIVYDEGIAQPILLGDEQKIKTKATDLGLTLKGIKIINPDLYPERDKYAKTLFEIRARKGVTLTEAYELIRNKNVFGSLMVHHDEADALISGVSMHYPDTIKPALQIIQLKKGLSKVSGLYLLIIKDEIYFFADTTVNIEPSADDLAEIAICTADIAKKFDIEPKIAMLSFSNFGSTKHLLAEKVRKATELIREKAPELIVDGEMQADTAVAPEIIKENYPFSTLKDKANILIFPDLQSGNIAYKLLHRLGGAEIIGPILMGMAKSVHVLQRGCEVNDIVNMTAIAVVDAQQNK